MNPRSFLSSTCSADDSWLVPETFACLEILSSKNQKDSSYEVFSLEVSENRLDRVSRVRKLMAIS